MTEESVNQAENSLFRMKVPVASAGSMVLSRSAFYVLFLSSSDDAKKSALKKMSRKLRRPMLRLLRRRDRE